LTSAENEVAEEFLPFGVGGNPVFIGRPLRPPPGQECQVGLDGLFGVDGLVSDRDVDVPVPGDNLGDMRRQAVHDGIRDEESPEIVGCVAQGAAVGGIGKAGVLEGAGEQVAGDVGPAVMSPSMRARRWLRPPSGVSVIPGPRNPQKL
jgi:hypothetical protein